MCSTESHEVKKKMEKETFIITNKSNNGDLQTKMTTYRIGCVCLQNLIEKNKIVKKRVFVNLFHT